MIRNSRYVEPSERSRLVRDFGYLHAEPVYEQQERKLRFKKLLTESPRYQGHVSVGLQ